MSKRRDDSVRGAAPKTSKPGDRNRPRDLVKIQPRLVSQPEELAALEQLRNAGQARRIAKFLDARARRAVSWWKSQMGIKAGRPRKSPGDTTGLLCAARVEGWLMVFYPAMQTKRDLQKKFRNLSIVKELLVKEGYTPEQAEIAISTRTPFQAACTWVGRDDRRHRSPETVANYHRRYRRLLWRYVPPGESCSLPRATVKPRIFIELSASLPSDHQKDPLNSRNKFGQFLS